MIKRSLEMQFSVIFSHIEKKKKVYNTGCFMSALHGAALCEIIEKILVTEFESYLEFHKSWLEPL